MFAPCFELIGIAVWSFQEPEQVLKISDHVRLTQHSRKGNRVFRKRFHLSPLWRAVSELLFHLQVIIEVFFPCTGDLRSAIHSRASDFEGVPRMVHVSNRLFIVREVAAGDALRRTIFNHRHVSGAECSNPGGDESAPGLIDIRRRACSIGFQCLVFHPCSK